MKRVLFRKRELELMRCAILSVTCPEAVSMGDQEKQELKAFYEQRLVRVMV